MGLKKGTNSFHKAGRGVRKQETVIMCNKCRKPIRQGIVWVRSGVVVRVKQPYHKECI